MISYVDKNSKKILSQINPSEQTLMKMVCPKCNSIGRFYRHGFYVRFLVVLLSIANVFINQELEVRVLRVKCINCKKTHAILDCNIIPYCRYSLSFILEVLASYYIDKLDILNICDEFEINDKTFKLFIDYYHKELVDLKAYYQNGSLSDNDLFEELIYEKLSDFLLKYFQNTKRHLFHFTSSGTYSKFLIRSFHITFFIL